MRRAPIGTFITMAACLAACSPQPPAARVAAAKAPIATPSVAAAVPKVAPTKPAGVVLRPPVTTFTTVSGSLRLDADYLVRKAGGRVVSLGGVGAPAFSAGGEPSGAGVVSNDGAGVVSNDGAGVVSNDGAGVVVLGDAALIGQDGAGVIAAGGGGIVAPARYQLQAEGATVGVGTILPVAGMVVTATSLRTGQPLPIGIDALGQPAFGVYSDGKGEFKLYLSGVEIDNVLLQARVQSDVTGDARLGYDMLAALKAGAEQDMALINEDTAAVTGYIRDVYADVLIEVLVGDVERQIAASFSMQQPPPGLAEESRTQLLKLRRTAEAKGIKEAPAATIYAVARRCVEAAMARIPFDKVTVAGSSERGIDVLVRHLREIREGARSKLTADPAYFADRTYLKQANSCRPEGEAFKIERPGDLGPFLMREYGKLDGTPRMGFLLMGWTDVAGVEDISPVAAAIVAISNGMNAAINEDIDGARTAILEILEAYTPAQPLPPGLPVPVMPPSPCPL